MFSILKKYLGLFEKSDLVLPFILLLVYLFFLIVVRGVIPTSDELITTFAKLYADYGYQIIFLAALLESLVLVNLFVPGQLGMALGAVFARSGQTELGLVILFASLGAISGYLIDFILGYFGFSDVIKKMGYGGILAQAQKQLKKFGKRGLIFGFLHSNVGAFLSVIAGATNVSWKLFIPISTISTFFWLSLWGILIYLVGDIILLLISKYSFLLILFVGAGLVLVRLWREEGSRDKLKTKS